MIINYNKKTIQIKIVYFGMKEAGKTTSLRNILKHFGKELKAIESIGKTSFFDFGTLTITGNEWNLKIMVLSAKPQDFYANTRPATIEMVDGIVFVVDSQKKYLKENTQAWKELSLYFGEKIYELPLIVCLNKQDLPDLVDVSLIEESFDLVNYRRYEMIKSVANRNENVLKGLKNILHIMFPSIIKKEQ